MKEMRDRLESKKTTLDNEWDRHIETRKRLETMNIGLVATGERLKRMETENR